VKTLDTEWRDKWTYRSSCDWRWTEHRSASLAPPGHACTN